MILKTKWRLVNFAPLFLLFIAGIILFSPTFDLYTFGDNWMVFWGGRATLGTGKLWGNWGTYFSPYGASYLILYFVYKWFGPSGSVLYLASFFCRLFASFLLYVFLRGLKQPRISAFFGSMIFLTSPIGLQVTDWAFQMTSYLSIGVFLFYLTIVFRISSLKNAFLALVSLFFAVALNPIRSHGIILITGFELLAAFFFWDRNNRRYVAILALSVVVLLFYMLNKNTFGDPLNTRSMLEPGVNMVRESISSNDFSLLINLFTNVGNGIIPGPLYAYFGKLGLSKALLGHYRPSFELIILNSSLVAFLLFWKKTKKRNSLSILFLSSIMTYFFSKFFLAPDMLIAERLASGVGFIFIFIFFIFIFSDILGKDLKNLQLDIAILGFGFFFLLLPWVHNPVGVLETYHRYLIYSSLVLPIIYVSLARSFRTRFLYFGIGLLFIFLFARSTLSDIAKMNYRHGNRYGEKIWSQIDDGLSNEVIGETREIFYFSSDNPERLHETVVFGFPFRMGLIYSIEDFNKLPMPVDNIDEFKSMLTDGKASKRFVGQEQIFLPEEAYAFKIINDQVVRVKVEDLIEN